MCDSHTKSSVGEDIMVLICPVVPFVRPFVGTDLVTTLSHAQLQQFR